MTNCRRPGPVSGGGDGVTSLNQPPPFLTKTYDIVDDPSTDPIISWGSDGSSFVVWKHSEFARDLLPRHFKHNNFSSFVRQLNTYGFRKVDPDRWEFANESFVRGHKELLRDIHRRKPAAQPNSQSSLVATNQSAIELGNFGGGYGGITDQVDNLKRDKNVLMLEVVRLRQQQQEQSGKIKDLQTRLDTTEQRQHDIMMFLARVAQNPAIIQQLFRAVQASANNVQRITNAKPGTGGQTSPATQATSTSTGQDESTKPAPRKKRRAAGDSDSDTEANSNNSGSAQENNPTAIIQYTPNQNGNFSEFFFKQLGMLSESNSRQDSEMVAQAFHNLSIATTSTVPGAPSVTIQEQPSSSLHAQGSGVLPANPDATFLGPHLVTTGQAQPSASSFTSFPPPLPPSVIHAPAPSSPPLPQSPLGPSLMVTADPTVTMMGLPTAMQIGGGSSSGMSVPMVSESPMMGGVVGTLPSSVEMPSMGSPPHLPVPHISLLGHPLDLPITSNPEVSLPDQVIEDYTMEPLTQPGCPSCSADEMIEDFSMELLGNLQPMSAGSGTADMLSEEMKDEFWNQLFASNEAALHQLSDGSLDLSNVLAHDLVASIIKAEEHPTSGAM